MGVRWLVNAALLVLPVGTTVGILLGVDSVRSSNGQSAMFAGDTSTSSNGLSNIMPSGGVVTVQDNGITEHMYCQKQVGISPASKGTRYTLNPNQWGWTEGTPGNMCMNVTTFQNNTYATANTAPDFSVTWQYPVGPSTQPVHAFPNIQIEQVLPLSIKNLKTINLDLAWTYGIGNEPVASTDEAVLLANLVNTNVAVDMFLDENETNSKNSSKAAYEVMVWFAKFGTATEPIGLQKGVIATESVAGTTFNLYTGQNGFAQNVLTWVSSATTETFTGDIAPLVSKLSTISGVTFPADTLIMGHLGVGSEAFSSNVNVTFSVPTLAIEIDA